MKCFSTQPENESKDDEENEMSCVIQTQYGPIKDSIKLTKRRIPTPLDNEVVVKVHTVALNPVDYKCIVGDFENLFKLKFPCIIGHDFAGTIHKIGKNVTKYKQGMKVMGFKAPSKMGNGTFAEYISVNSTHIAEMPSNMSFIQAGGAGSIVLSTYASLFIQSNLKSCKSLLIFGGSTSTGMIGIQYAKALGVTNIIVTTSDGKELCESLGATHIINYKTEDIYESISKLKLKDPITIIYDCVGGLHHWELSLKILPSNGTCVRLVGDENKGKITTSQLTSAMFKMMGRKFKSIFNSPNYKPLLGFDPSLGWDYINKLIKQNKLIIPIDKNYKPFKFNLNNVIEMCNIQKKGKLKGKLIMEIIPSSSTTKNDDTKDKKNSSSEQNGNEQITPLIE